MPVTLRRFYQYAWFILLGVFLISVWFGVVGWATGPRAGFHVQFLPRGAVVDRLVTPAPAYQTGVRIGDRLVAIDDMPPTEALWEAQGDRRATFTFEQPSGETLTVPAAAADTAGRISMILLEFSAGIFALVGVLVVSRSHPTSETAAFSWLSLIAAIGIAAAPGASANHTVALRIEASALHWLPVVFVVFFYAFGRSKLAPETPWTRWLIVLPIVAVALDIAAALESTVAPSIRPVAVAFDYTYFAGGVMLGMALLVCRYMRSRSDVFKEQTRVIIVGTALAVFPVTFLSAIPEAAGLGAVVRAQYTVPATVMIPLAFGYAILRHELMGIRRLVHRGISYVLISAFVLLVYVGVLTALRRLGAGTVSNSTLDLSVMVAILIGVPLVPQVRALAIAAVDRLLYRDFVNHRELLREVSVAAVHVADLGSLSSGPLQRILHGLALTFVAYAEKQQDGGAEVLGTAGEVPVQVADDAVMAPARASEAAATQGVVLGGSPEPVLRAAVSGPREQACLLYLGPKANGEPFRSDDVELAQTAASLLSTLVARLRLLEELRGKSDELSKLNMRLVEVEEQQLSKLSGYLHDEPLQKVTYVLGQYREKYSEDELTRILLDVTNDLRLVSGTLSPAMLVDLGLVRALESMVREFEGRNRFHVNFQVSGLDREERLPTGVELTAYRVAQEALANCQKHSKATAVWIELAVSPDTLVLSVDDNGVGLNGTAAHSSNGAHLGLRHLKQRVESYGGALLVTNRRSRGTSLVATIPITKETTDAVTEFRIHAN